MVAITLETRAHLFSSFKKNLVLLNFIFSSYCTHAFVFDPAFNIWVNVQKVKCSLVY